MVVTDRTMELIHESRGFDHYLLKTPACDLKSELALKLKRHILQALQTDCAHIVDDPAKRQRIVTEYKQYLDQYTPEEVEWYGLSWAEAIMKMRRILQEQEKIVPQKIVFRSQLIERLKAAGVAEALEPKSDKATEHLHLQ